VTANIRLECICSVGCHSPGIRRGQPSPPSGGWLLDTYPRGTYSAPATRDTTRLLESTQREQFVDLNVRLARHACYSNWLAVFPTIDTTVTREKASGFLSVGCKTYMMG
jgi:hypothetical protein